MSSKVLTPVTDKNGVHTSRWRNVNPNEYSRVSTITIPPTLSEIGVVSIEPTGEWDKGEFLFTHAVIENESGLLDLLSAHPEVDLVSVRRTGNVDFMHISGSGNESAIWENGLIVNIESKPDLGNGTYAFSRDNIDGIDNVMDYVNELHDDDEEELAIVRGSYTGDCLECIYGDGHVGYLVFENGVKPEMIQDIEISTVGDMIEGHPDW